MSWKRWLRSEADTSADNEVKTEDAVAVDGDGRRTGDAPLADIETMVPPQLDRPAFLDELWNQPLDAPSRTTLPRFTASASDDIETSGTSEIVRRKLALRDTLGASQPVINREVFAGRHDAMAQLITSIEQNRVHVVIYGERGIGKTSLAHVFAETAREARYLVLYGSCGSDAQFSSMFRAFLARIPRLYHASVLPNSPEAEQGDNFDSMLPEDFGPRELADVLAGVTGTRVLIILDEYDRVVDVEFRRDVAELIKNLSDRAARVQLVLTGVAQNLDELIGYAPSIRRNIVGLPMRPLTPAEVKALIALGEKAAELRYSDDATKMITTMAGGSPYLARLLAHAAGLSALDEEARLVTAAHGRAAVERVLTDWNASLPRRVQVNLAREEARANWPLLIAAARAGSSADGFFSADDVITELGKNAVGGLANPAYVERELKQFSGPQDLLERSDVGGAVRFRFAYPGVSSLLLISAALARLTND
ncbi:MAG: AAA family ATPase [Polymorphobacter sp.]|uniref:AAA family ATPase n=1 Tax=Polymorphobacter sp. TaxID=1909290 RepID=UPI003A8BE4BD